MAKLPDLTPMKSSLFSGSHYDPETMTLTVQMGKGGTYTYTGVPIDKAEAFMGNASPGSFFGAKIRGLYPATKL